MPPRDNVSPISRGSKIDEENWGGEGRELGSNHYQLLLAGNLQASMAGMISKDSSENVSNQLAGQLASHLVLSNRYVQQQPHVVEIARLRSEMRNLRIGQAMQALEIGRLRQELESSNTLCREQSAELSFLRGELSRHRLSGSEKAVEMGRLRRELDKSGDSQTELSAEIACLRGELQSEHEVRTQQQIELNRSRRELEYLKAAKMEQTGEVSRLHNILDSMNSVDFMQLEDYSIRALQIELKADARRGISGPDAVLMEAPEDYTGCRQFFQTGLCHFGRGRRPCPNENSHLCLHCGRHHGTAPHLILLRRISDCSLNNNTQSN